MARQPDPDQAPATYRALVGGLHTTAAVIAHDGAPSGVQLQLSRSAPAHCSASPAGELAGIDLDAADLLGRLADDLHEQMRDAPTWPDRFRLLDAGLGRLVDPARRPPAEVCHAWHLLRASQGTSGSPTSRRRSAGANGTWPPGSARRSA